MEAVTQAMEYTYDVFDRRIARAHDTTSPFDLDDAVIERYVLDDVNGVASLDGGNVVLDFVDPDGDGQDPTAVARRCLFGNQVDQLLAQENVAESPSSADRVYWPLVDHLQTVRNLYGNDASAVEHYEYGTSGRLVDGDSSLTRYLFTSREIDMATTHQYNRARWYDRTTGGCASDDPIHFTAQDANLSRYISNRYVLTSDPSGLADGIAPLDAVIGISYDIGIMLGIHEGSGTSIPDALGGIKDHLPVAIDFILDTYPGMLETSWDAMSDAVEEATEAGTPIEAATDVIIGVGIGGAGVGFAVCGYWFSGNKIMIGMLDTTKEK